ncbi:Pre-mRNA-splicing factor cwf19 [Lithohypha guttulata]|nr:Pre-mRNA-splicing factor cwf19 [Lithohypha guttulata]
MPWEDGLDEFEKQLATEKEQREEKGARKRHSHRDKDERRHHHHHHHHKSHRDRDQDRDEHRSKRRRQSSDDYERREKYSHRQNATVTNNEPPTDIDDARPDLRGVRRDAWMEGPDSIDVDYVQKKRKEPSPPRQGSLSQDFEMRIHKNELNHHLRDLQNGQALDDIENEEAQHQVDYTFGDASSNWRMAKLKAVYRQAEVQDRKVEDIAIERYGNLREFDDAREEEIELERRDRLGKDYVGKSKPSGELFQERKLNSGVRRSNQPRADAGSDDEFDTILNDVSVPAPVAPFPPKLDQTHINKLKAQLMKAELRKDPNVEELRKQYDAAVASSSSSDPTVVQLSAMDSRMLSSAPRNETKSATKRRDQERGNVEENEDMTIEDMVAEERRTKTQAGGEAQRFAERIAKDAKFDNDLEYMDENATKLAKRVHKSDMNLRNMAISDYQKLNRILETCPLCHHEDNPSQPEPVAPVVSLATRTYLTLPTKPELAPYSTMIVPLQHHTNLLECDDDEWEEIRNFMKSLIRFYHSRDSDVIFYENAAFPNRRPHAALVAVPLPQSVGETSPAFFKEAFLSTESEWSQHKKIIDTLAKAKSGHGRAAFRKTLAKEMPYFHVWFEMDGGLGHVVEDPDKWPRGDLFAREVIGGMLGLETETIKKQDNQVFTESRSMHDTMSVPDTTAATEIASIPPKHTKSVRFAKKVQVNIVSFEDESLQEAYEDTIQDTLQDTPASAATRGPAQEQKDAPRTSPWSLINLTGFTIGHLNPIQTVKQMEKQKKLDEEFKQSLPWIQETLTQFTIEVLSTGGKFVRQGCSSEYEAMFDHGMRSMSFLVKNSRQEKCSLLGIMLHYAKRIIVLDASNFKEVEILNDELDFAEMLSVTGLKMKPPNHGKSMSKPDLDLMKKSWKKAETQWWSMEDWEDQKAAKAASVSQNEESM